MSSVHGVNTAMIHAFLSMQVVRSGGISPILQSSHGSMQADADASDSNAVGDALECLLQIVPISSEGKTIALESGCLEAAAQALKVDSTCCT